MSRPLLGLLLVGCGGAASTPAPPPPAPSSPAPPTPATTAAPLDCSAAGWCLENPTPWDLGGGELWGSARDDIWAAGNAGLLLHYDGKAWTRVQGIRKANLYAITGTARDNAWAVGYVGEALHWDGKSWRSQRIPTADLLATASADDTGRVWAASADRIWTRDGDTWKLAAELKCLADFCLTPKLRSASGGTLLVLPRGQTWNGTAVVADHPAPDRRFGGTRPSTIWVWIGGRSWIKRWDGKQWIELELPDKADIHAIWGATDTDVWMVGRAGAILRWDGRRFTTVDSRTSGDLDTVWGSAADDVWIAGAGGLLHWDGTALSTITSSVTTANLADVWGTGDCDVWAVGDRGTVLHRDCSRWTPIATTLTTPLHGVGGSGPDDVWFVGDGGAILHWDGRALASAPSPTTAVLRAVWAASPRDAWAVGDAGTILHWNGTAWTTATSPSTSALLRIEGVGPRDIVAVGAHGTVLEWDGLQWIDIRKPSLCAGSETHTGVAITPAGELLVTCRGSVVLHRSSGTWTRPPDSAGHASSYSDITARGNDLVATGWYGTIVAKRGNAGWAVEATLLAQPLAAVWISPTGTSFAVGAQGTILSHRPAP